MAAAKNGDPDAFDELVHLNTATMYRLAYRIVGSSSEAEDVVQDAWISIWRKLGEFRGESRLSTYLYRVTVNSARMHLRRNRRVLPSALDLAVADDEWRGPERRVEHSLRVQAVYTAVQELGVDQRLAVVLRDLEELSYADVAAILGISVSAVKSRLHRGRAKLAEALEEWR